MPSPPTSVASPTLRSEDVESVPEEALILEAIGGTTADDDEQEVETTFVVRFNHTFGLRTTTPATTPPRALNGSTVRF